ncbi:hypothetical protein BCR34DRAFT_602501 [Clohesyomyces aquaticus]|uniref:Uncharacterized protein n=1 Tax=Clohesyomyces aquaticus TaxID=1231657 RepID=A0A1Y1ZI86_9PLEO|nr:hypothetical protein BCR34DRAFT_602501 [Clohesyomyces aquaticus]
MVQITKTGSSRLSSYVRIQSDKYDTDTSHIVTEDPNARPPKKKAKGLKFVEIYAEAIQGDTATPNRPECAQKDKQKRSGSQSPTRRRGPNDNIADEYDPANPYLSYSRNSRAPAHTCTKPLLPKTLTDNPHFLSHIFSNPSVTHNRSHKIHESISLCSHRRLTLHFSPTDPLNIHGTFHLLIADYRSEIPNGHAECTNCVPYEPQARTQMLAERVLESVGYWTLRRKTRGVVNRVQQEVLLLVGEMLRAEGKKAEKREKEEERRREVEVQRMVDEMRLAELIERTKREIEVADLKARKKNIKRKREDDEEDGQGKEGIESVGVKRARVEDTEDKNKDDAPSVEPDVAEGVKDSATESPAAVPDQPAITDRYSPLPGPPMTLQHTPPRSPHTSPPRPSKRKRSRDSDSDLQTVKKVRFTTEIETSLTIEQNQHLSSPSPVRVASSRSAIEAEYEVDYEDDDLE